MKRTRPSDIKALLAQRDIRPSRVLGQNFLIDENILHIILDSAHVAESDTVLEVGPGLGVLTEHLVARAAHLIGIEKDPKLAAYLRDMFEQQPRFELIEGDALEQDLDGLLRDREITHVVSNLPYSAGTRILMDLVASLHRPLRMVVMLQWDVAERLAAAPGSKAYGIASIYVQMYYEVILRKTVSPTCFYPPPDVRSALVECYRRGEPQVALDDPDHFKELIKWCFSQRRKQIGRILQNAPSNIVPAGAESVEVLAATGLTTEQRPESIAVSAWGQLSNALVQRR